MFAPGPIRPITLSLEPAPGHQAAVLRPGHALQGVVQGTPGNLTLQIASTRVPLEPQTPLQPGQQVHVEVRQGAEGLQLRISPLPQPAPAAAGSASQLAPVLTSVLEHMGLLQQAGTAAHLMPRALPPFAQAVRDLLALFHHRVSLGGDLERFAALARQAVRGGAVPGDATRGLDELLARLLARDAGGIEGALRAWAGQRGALEARLARALAEHGLDNALARLRGDLRAQISRLRDNPGLLRFLRSAGSAHEFETLGDRLLSRLSGGDLQNLRAFEQPYLFIDLPFAGDSPIRHAHIHILGEQTGGRNAFDGANAMVALDVSTARLGDLWISLRVVQGRCSCTVAAVSEEAVEAIEGASGELAEALARAGYPDAAVRVRTWNGDRFAEAAGLAGTFSGLDVEA